MQTTRFTNVNNDKNIDLLGGIKMLDDYKERQNIVYKILKTSVNKNEISHAYLFETNGYTDSHNLIMAFIKTLLCPNSYLNREKCGKCHQCEVIESGNFPEIKNIKPEGLWIKKNQLKELQNEFNETALIGNKRIYIISQADRLNISAANSILKFLEEPEEGIIAILVTENTSGILETIKSRCQIIRMTKDKIIKKNTPIDTIKKIIYNNEDLEKDNLDGQINNIINFVNYYEKNHLNTILYMQKLWHDNIKNKEESLKAFEIMILYYKDILNIKLNKKTEIFDENNEIKYIVSNNTVSQISTKIKILIDKKNNIKYNANIKLLMDKLIIDFEGGS